LALSQEQYDLMMHYSAAMMYMAYEPRKESWSLKSVYESNDGSPGAHVRSSYLSPYFHMPGIGEEWEHPDPANGRVYKFNFPYTFYLPLGKPLKSCTPGDIECYRYKNTPLLVREFENGLIILNPTGDRNAFEDVDAAVDKEISSEKYDLSDLDTPMNCVIKLDHEYLDPQTMTKVSGELMVPYASGKILLKRGNLAENPDKH